MNSSIFFDAPLSDQDRRTRLYAGDIFVLAETPGSRELIALARDLLEDSIRTARPSEHPRAQDGRRGRRNPLQAQAAVHSPPDVQDPAAEDRCGKRLRSREDLLRRSADAFGLSAAFPPLGYRLRLSPASRHLVFGADVPAQLVDADLSARTRQRHGVLPALLQRASPEQLGDLQLLRVEHQEPGDRRAARQDRHARAAQAATGPRPSDRATPSAARCHNPVLRAQLHETVENTTGVARYSIDFRTVHYDDVVARRGAPNVDSRCTGTTMRDYLRCTDLAHLPDDVVKLYDDGTEIEDRILYFGERLATNSAS